MNNNMANPWVGFIALLFATFVTIEAAAFLVRLGEIEGGLVG